MPNISFDIFFNDDVVNITASRSQGSAPKVKPAWKTRTAPKLPKKVEPKTAAFAKPDKPRVTEVDDSEEEEKPKEQKKVSAPPKKEEKKEDKPKDSSEKKKIPKLAPKSSGSKKAANGSA